MMRKYFLLELLCFVSLLILGSCEKDGGTTVTDNRIEESVVPSISLVSTGTTNLIEFVEPLSFFIEYRDGDGDLGYSEADSMSVYVTDLRNDLTDEFYLPLLAPKDTEIIIQGILEIVIEKLIIFDDDTDSETTSFEIKLRDRAGHWSNIISSPEITINR